MATTDTDTNSERRLRSSERQLRRLAARLQAVREEERRRLARELHDELGQTLTAIKLELARTITLFKQHGIYPAGVDRLQSLVGLAEIGLSTVKRVTTDLHPGTLDHLGLAEALRWEAKAFRARSGIQCHVTADRDKT